MSTNSKINTCGVKNYPFATNINVRSSHSHLSFLLRVKQCDSVPTEFLNYGMGYDTLLYELNEALNSEKNEQ